MNSSSIGGYCDNSNSIQILQKKPPNKYQSLLVLCSTEARETLLGVSHLMILAHWLLTGANMRRTSQLVPMLQYDQHSLRAPPEAMRLWLIGSVGYVGCIYDCLAVVNIGNTSRWAWTSSTCTKVIGKRTLDIARLR